ncbi:hypothetical protein ACFX1Q_044593 [Malus domestica]
MQSPCWKEVTEVCLSGCCPRPLQKLSAHHHHTMSNSGSTSTACRRDFAATTSSSIFPNTVFTNHKSLPSLHESFADFTNVYPKYHEIDEAVIGSEPELVVDPNDLVEVTTDGEVAEGK